MPLELPQPVKIAQKVELSLENLQTLAARELAKGSTVEGAAAAVVKTAQSYAKTINYTYLGKPVIVDGKNGVRAIITRMMKDNSFNDVVDRARAIVAKACEEAGDPTNAAALQKKIETALLAGEIHSAKDIQKILQEALGIAPIRRVSKGTTITLDKVLAGEYEAALRAFQRGLYDIGQMKVARNVLALSDAVGDAAAQLREQRTKLGSAASELKAATRLVHEARKRVLREAYHTAGAAVGGSFKTGDAAVREVAAETWQFMKKPVVKYPAVGAATLAAAGYGVEKYVDRQVEKKLNERLGDTPVARPEPVMAPTDTTAAETKIFNASDLKLYLGSRQDLSVGQKSAIWDVIANKYGTSQDEFTVPRNKTIADLVKEAQQ